MSTVASSCMVPVGHSVALSTPRKFWLNKTAAISVILIALAIGLLAATTIVYTFTTGQSATFTSAANGTWNVTSPDGTYQAGVSNSEASQDLHDWSDAGGGVWYKTINGKRLEN